MNTNPQIPPLAASPARAGQRLPARSARRSCWPRSSLAREPAKPELDEPGGLLRRDAGQSETACRPITWPCWRSWTATTGSCWPPWSGKAPGSARSKRALPGWMSARRDESPKPELSSERLNPAAACNHPSPSEESGKGEGLVRRASVHGERCIKGAWPISNRSRVGAPWFAFTVTPPPSNRPGVLPAAEGRPGQPPGTSYDTPHARAGKTSALLGQTNFGARSFVGPQRLAAAGPRAPFHNNNKRKEINE